MLTIKEIAEILGVSVHAAASIARREEWERKSIIGLASYARKYVYKITREELEAIKNRPPKLSDEQIAMMQGWALAGLESAFNRVQARKKA
jgi:hypothetical protein